MNLAKKLDDLGAKIWATPQTAKAIESLGIEVAVVNKLRDDNSIMDLVESGQLDYIVYTGKSDKKSIADYIKLHNRANQLGIATITSLDTANAVADIIASRYKQTNTELVDINDMRESKGILKFSKMQGCCDDYIFFNNQCGIITCPESFAIEFSDRHKASAVTALCSLRKARLQMQKCVYSTLMVPRAKWPVTQSDVSANIYTTTKLLTKTEIDIETAAGIRHLSLYTRNGKVSSVTVDMARQSLSLRAFLYYLTEKAL